MNLKIILCARSQTQECVLIPTELASAGERGQWVGKGLRETSRVTGMFSVLTGCDYTGKNTSQNELNYIPKMQALVSQQSWAGDFCNWGNVRYSPHLPFIEEK